jgi:hypothetical protein
MVSKKLVKIFLMVSGLAVSGVAFGAQDTYDVGSQTATWLNLPDSPRTAAMGDASVALGGDVNTLSVNPAGLSDLGGQQLSLMEDSDVQNMSFEHIAYGLDLGPADGVAVSVDYMNYGSIAEYEQQNGLLVPNGTVQPYGLGVDLGYGHAIGDFSVGGTVQLVTENLGVGENSTVGGDLGLQWRHQAPSGWAAGLAVRNFGAQLDDSDLPTVYQAGVAYYQSLLAGEQGLNFTADAAVPTAEVNAESLSFGAEYTGYSLWAIRAGYRFIGNNGVGGLSVGGGLKYRGIAIDYAFVNGGVLGNANLISLSILLPSSAIPAPTPLPTPLSTPVAVLIPTPIMPTAIPSPPPTPEPTLVSTPLPTLVATPVPLTATAILLAPPVTFAPVSVTAVPLVPLETPIPLPELNPIILHNKKDVMSGYYVTVHTTFVKGSSTLSPVGEAQLKQGYAWLVQYPSSKVSVYGYTDSQGSAGSNDQLSARRAREVVRYLKALGLNPQRIVRVKGWGSSHPIALNSTAAGRLVNRRVELRITGENFD